jgi:hypothetical protein
MKKIPLSAALRQAGALSPHELDDLERRLTEHLAVQGVHRRRFLGGRILLRILVTLLAFVPLPFLLGYILNKRATTLLMSAPDRYTWSPNYQHWKHNEWSLDKSQSGSYQLRRDGITYKYDSFFGRTTAKKRGGEATYAPWWWDTRAVFSGQKLIIVTGVGWDRQRARPFMTVVTTLYDSPYWQKPRTKHSLRIDAMSGYPLRSESITFKGKGNLLVQNSYHFSPIPRTVFDVPTHFVPDFFDWMNVQHPGLNFADQRVARRQAATLSTQLPIVAREHQWSKAAAMCQQLANIEKQWHYPDWQTTQRKAEELLRQAQSTPPLRPR